MEKHGFCDTNNEKIVVENAQVILMIKKNHNLQEI